MLDELEFGTLDSALTENTAAAFAVKLPVQVSPGSAVVTASGNLTFGHRTVVSSSSGTGVTSTTGSGTLNVGIEAKPRSVIANSGATIGDRAKVNGDLVVAGASTIGTGVEVYGQRQLQTPVNEQVSFTVPVFVPDVNGGNVNVEPDRQLTLSPAKYGTVSVKSRSTIILSTGVYEFDTLQVLEPQARIRIDDAAGPVVIYVKTSFIYRGGVQNTAVDGRFPNLLFVYLGTNELLVESPFQGHLFAPNATSQIRPGTGPFVGSFWGKHVTTNPDTVFVHKSFDLEEFFPKPDQPKLTENEDPYVLDQDDAEKFNSEDPILATPASGVSELPEGKPDAVNCVTNLIAVPSNTAGRAQRFRYMTAQERAAAGCVKDYRECAVDAQGKVLLDAQGNPVQVATPTEAQLNVTPSAQAKCAQTPIQAISYTEPNGSVTSVRVCGVDDSVLTLPAAQRRSCTMDSQCNAAAGELCAKFCPPGESCEDEADFVRYCAPQRKNCDPLPEQATCTTRNVCPFEEFSGPASNDAPRETKPSLPAEDEVLLPTAPTLAGYKRSSCSDVTPDPITSADETTPPQDSGNDQWGISFTPILNYGFTTPSSPLGLDDSLGANGEASFKVNAKVWGLDVPILDLGVDGTIGPDEQALRRTTQLFGQDVDLTGDIDLTKIPTNVADLATQAVRGAMVEIRDDFHLSQSAQGELFAIGDYLASHDFSDLSLPDTQEDAQEFCELTWRAAREFMGPAGKYKSTNWCDPIPQCQAELDCVGPLCECPPEETTETAQQAAVRFRAAVDDAVAAWGSQVETQLATFDGDPNVALAEAIALIQNQMPGNNPDLVSEIPLRAGRHRFAAFSYGFTFPVGPVPVTMEIELAGSWGLEANLELEGQFDPLSDEDLFARAGASVVPGMDIQALAFAGVNVGFAQVGIGGELTLIDIEIPIRGGGEVTGERQTDERPLTLEVAGGDYQDISDLSDSVVRLATTKWNAGFYYGAGMHTEILAGNINLQARIRLVFFSTTFRQVLAQWSGIPFYHSFVGSVQPVQGLSLPPEVQEVVTGLTAAGKDLANVQALVPLADEGFTGYFGTQMPLLTQAGVAAIWPPAYDAAAPVVGLPSEAALCLPPDPRVPR